MNPDTQARVTLFVMSFSALVAIDGMRITIRIQCDSEEGQFKNLIVLELTWKRKIVASAVSIEQIESSRDLDSLAIEYATEMLSQLMTEDEYRAWIVSANDCMAKANAIR